MKNLLLLFVCLALFSPKNYGQFYELNQARGTGDNAFDLQKVNFLQSGEAVWLTRTENGSFDQIWASRLDSGETVTHILFQNAEPEGFSYIPYSGGYVVLVNSVFECDFFYNGAIYAAKTDGTPSWTTNLMELGIPFNPGINTAAIYPIDDEKVLLADSIHHQLVISTANGEIIGEKNIHFPNFMSKLVHLSSGAKLLTSFMGVTITSPDYETILDTLSLQNVWKIEELSTGDFIFLTTDKIVKTDAQLNIQSSQNFPIPTSKIVSFAADTSSFLILGKEPLRLLRYNHAMELQQTDLVGSDMPFVPKKMISLDNDRIALVGDGRSQVNDITDLSQVKNFEIRQILQFT